MSPAEPDYEYARPELVGGRSETEARSVEQERPRSPQREGLPPGFRMRHDVHFVDALAIGQAEASLRTLPITRLRATRPSPEPGELEPLMRSIRQSGLVQPLVVRPRGRHFEVVSGNARLAAASAAGLERVPCIVQDVGDERARHLADAARVHADRRPDNEPSERDQMQGGPRVSMPAGAVEEIERSLRSIVSSAEMMRSAPGELLERAGRDLMTAEARRCEWMIGAGRELESPTPLRIASFALMPVIERLQARLEPECKVLGVATGLEKTGLALENAHVKADESQVTMALEGLYRAQLSLLSESSGGTLVTVVGFGTRAATVEINQSGALRAGAEMNGLFDPDGRQLPYLCALGTSIARAVLERHGGCLEPSTPSAGFGVRASMPL